MSLSLSRRKWKISPSEVPAYTLSSVAVSHTLWAGRIPHAEAQVMETVGLAD